MTVRRHAGHDRVNQGFNGPFHARRQHAGSCRKPRHKRRRAGGNNDDGNRRQEKAARHSRLESCRVEAGVSPRSPGRHDR